MADDDAIIVATDDSIRIANTTFKLTDLKGWDKLKPDKQKFLQVYAVYPQGNVTARIKAGLEESEVNAWVKNDTTFRRIKDTIYNLHTDQLKLIDFKDAFANSKIRGRVIQARERDGDYNKDESSQHNHIHTGETLSDLLKALKD